MIPDFLAHNPKVEGSNPSPATNKNKGLRLISVAPFLVFVAHFWRTFQGTDVTGTVLPDGEAVSAGFDVSVLSAFTLTVPAFGAWISMVVQLHNGTISSSISFFNSLLLSQPFRVEYGNHDAPDGHHCQPRFRVCRHCEDAGHHQPPRHYQRQQDYQLCYLKQIFHVGLLMAP